jgi:hypothetical protein
MFKASSEVNREDYFYNGRLCGKMTSPLKPLSSYSFSGNNTGVSLQCFKTILLNKLLRSVDLIK